MRTHAPIWAIALLVAASLGCQRRPGLSADPAARDTDAPATNIDPAAAARGRRGQAGRRTPAGSACSGRDDCPSDQSCVDARCEYRATSVSGEILAAAAAAQEQAGDWDGAIETYQAALTRFSEASAPVPPRIVCAAADLTLRSARNAEARERGARAADQCFRAAVPGHPARAPVQRALARLRYEGLEIALFDADVPPERFFTQEPSRPTVDVVEVEIAMPDLEPASRSHAGVRERLQSDEGRRAVADCFVQDWEVRHEGAASAELVLRYSVRLRDMGSYDVFEPQLAFERTTRAEDGFEACLARSLPELFGANQRGTRGEPWNQAVRFAARVQ
ncbi:MAG: hypothetical protein KF729_20085 [Sandaracinaceae bacterium]|nr:hypothetical protein [Sandaracinaceae bacterium]